VIQSSLPDDEPTGGAPGSGSAAGGSAAGPATDRAPSLPPNPTAYDSERNVAARARGLAAPYIPGGRDPDQERADREDRRYLKILVIMVVVIILAGFVFGILAALVGLDSLFSVSD
jgi:hypothetical protein